MNILNDPILNKARIINGFTFSSIADFSKDLADAPLSVRVHICEGFVEMVECFMKDLGYYTQHDEERYQDLKKRVFKVVVPELEHLPTEVEEVLSREGGELLRGPLPRLNLTQAISAN